jgi:Mitochondrial carrier protein
MDDRIFVRITTISSIFAGIIGKIVCHPIDTLRAKIQVQRDMLTLGTYRGGMIKQTLR